jgi:hypothetical protein
VSQASKEEEEIRMQNRDSFYMQILGSKGRAEDWEEYHPWYT